MYFPYLRGKQYELLALRDLAEIPLDKSKIIPIIEPVKKSLRSLETALKALKAIDVKVQLIVNPMYGELNDDSKILVDFIEGQKSSSLDNIIPTFLVNNDHDVDFIITCCEQNGYDKSGFSLIHMSPVRSIDRLASFCEKNNCFYNVFHINHVFALRRKFKSETQAILGDYFDKQRVNADYRKDVDKSFSSDCFFYKNEGFVAFSDFQVIGAGWVEGGWSPVAVAIHLTYKDSGTDDIRIHHFVSDSSDQDLDIAGRFHEALTKLVKFADERKLQSTALDEFFAISLTGSFHGLGIVKKLSIMHHIELMQELI